MIAEKIVLNGHIIDSLVLPKVLDEITAMGGDYSIKKICIGKTRRDPSRAVIEVSASGRKELSLILGRIRRQGAEFEEPQEVMLAKAPKDGMLPDDFYSTTNLATEVFVNGGWITVNKAEMDCAIVVAPGKDGARTVRMADVAKGDLVVVGDGGVRVLRERTRGEGDEFRFMRCGVSSERPKEVIIREIASQMREVKRIGGKVLLVGGPAVVHTGAGRHVEEMIEKGYINVLFAGNALAAHDIEYALFETSLGMYLDRGQSAQGGHGHHVRAINTIRRAGGIRKAVSKGILKSGIMFTCVKRNIPFVLAGSIRDDGPLPEVITDVMAAQREMRSRLEGVKFVLMIATALHSVAVGNLLPASMRVVCVDINPSTVTKLADRGTFQAAGVVTDAELFLRELSGVLAEDEG